MRREEHNMESSFLDELTDYSFTAFVLCSLVYGIIWVIKEILKVTKDK